MRSDRKDDIGNIATATPVPITVDNDVVNNNTYYYPAGISACDDY